MLPATGLLTNGENVIGHMVDVRDSDNIKSYCRDAADFVCLSLHHNKFNLSSSSFVTLFI